MTKFHRANEEWNAETIRVCVPVDDYAIQCNYKDCFYYIRGIFPDPKSRCKNVDILDVATCLDYNQNLMMKIKME